MTMKVFGVLALLAALLSPIHAGCGGPLGAFLETKTSMGQVETTAPGKGCVADVPDKYPAVSASAVDSANGITYSLTATSPTGPCAIRVSNGVSVSVTGPIPDSAAFLCSGKVIDLHHTTSSTAMSPTSHLYATLQVDESVVVVSINLLSPSYNVTHQLSMQALGTLTAAATNGRAVVMSFDTGENWFIGDMTDPQGTAAKVDLSPTSISGLSYDDNVLGTLYAQYKIPRSDGAYNYTLGAFGPQGILSSKLFPRISDADAKLWAYDKKHHRWSQLTVGSDGTATLWRADCVNGPPEEWDQSYTFTLPSWWSSDSGSLWVSPQ